MEKQGRLRSWHFFLKGLKIASRMRVLMMMRLRMPMRWMFYWMSNCRKKRRPLMT